MCCRCCFIGCFLRCCILFCLLTGCFSNSLALGSQPGLLLLVLLTLHF
jgi:hypothetical protein